jgi:hypothetical protein
VKRAGVSNREERAIQSLLDVLEELSLGLAHGQTPSVEWAEIVQSNFDKHRRELRGEDVEWEEGL